MSSFIWCEIVCSKCSETIAGHFTTTTIPRRSMEKDAKKRGWKLAQTEFTDEDWFCNVCCADNSK